MATHIGICSHLKCMAASALTLGFIVGCSFSSTSTHHYCCTTKEIQDDCSSGLELLSDLRGEQCAETQHHSRLCSHLQLH
eukprot:1159481-Pelagomonas_calceolata.AAC.5